MRPRWLLAAVALLPVGALPQQGGLRLAVPAITAGKTVPERFASCRGDGHGRAMPAPDISPEVRWSGALRGTRSFAVVMRDTEVPEVATNVNIAVKTIARDEPRRVFYHWLLVDIPPATQALAEGSDGRGVTPHGKPLAGAPAGRRGVNDYTAFLAGDPAMKGVYAGYDGPCPPWNDARLHHYRLTVYALDVARLPLAAKFDGRDLERVLNGHVLAGATLTRTYATARPTPAR